MKVRTGLGVLVSALLATALLSGCGAPATPASRPLSSSPASAGPRSSIPAYLVTAQHVRDNLARSSVLDARPKADYDAGHIPGAINVKWQLFARVDAGKAGDESWGTLKSASDIASELGRLGVDPKKQIVVYTAPGGWGEDGRIVWMLRMAGFPNSMMLDGGYPTWTAAGYETSTEPAKAAATSVSIPALDRSWNVTTDAIVSGLGELTIVDARTAKEYAGATDFGEARGGHLPGAVNVPFGSMFNDDGTLKSVADLGALFDKVGLGPNDDIVVYCTKGIRSAHMTLVLRGLGFAKVRNYDASFYEWAGNSALEVVE